MNSAGLTTRDKPYIYVTWLPKLLVGENHCVWKVWFKAHFANYDKVPSSFDLAMWTMQHNSLLNRRRAELENHYYSISIEDQNSFQVEKGDFTLAGKPDLIAWKIISDRGIILISDAKTGRQKHSDQIQVLIYILVRKNIVVIEPLRSNSKQLSDKDVIEGEIVYTDNIIDIPASKVATWEANTMIEMNKLCETISSSYEPRRCPSKKECSWCDIPKKYCEERI